MLKCLQNTYCNFPNEVLECSSIKEFHLLTQKWHYFGWKDFREISRPKLVWKWQKKLKVQV